MSDFESLLLYISIYAISALVLTFGNKHKNNFLIFLSVMIPTLFTAVRFKVGTDWDSYYSAYMFISENNINIFLNTNIATELGIYIFTQIGNFFGSYQYFFGCFSFSMFLLIVLQLKNNYKHIPIGLASFIFLMTSFTTGINIMRQVLSACIVFYGFQYIFNGKYLKYIFSVIIAMLFHSTAIIALPLFLFWSSKKNRLNSRSFVLSLIAAFTIIALTMPQLINELSSIPFLSRFSVYIDRVDTGNNLTFLKDVFIFILLCFFYKPLLKKDKRNSFFYTLIFISLMFNISGYYSPFLKRISIYFELPIFIIIAQIPLIMKKNYKVLAYCLIVIYIIILFITLYYLYRQSGIIPYTTSF